MALRWKIFTGVLIVVLIIVAIIRFMPQKANANLFMAVDGDPRMSICQSPKDGKLADAVVIDALKINNPLVLEDANMAQYRVSVLRPADKKSITISFATPKGKTQNNAEIGIFENGKATFEKTNLTYEQAASLVNSFKDAKIWGALKPTLKPKNITIPADAIIEVAAPNISKCVATRYDDERISELLGDFDFRVSSVITKVSIDGFTPPGQKIFGKDYAPNKKLH